MADDEWEDIPEDEWEDEPDAPAPALAPAPTAAPAQPVAASTPEPSAMERLARSPPKAWDTMKDFASRPVEYMEPEVRGVALGSTGGFAPQIAPRAVGAIQQGLESAFPVDAPGTPAREYPEGSLAAATEASEQRAYGDALEQHPVRAGVGYALGSAPAFGYAAGAAPLSGASSLTNLARGSVAMGTVGGALQAHTGDPAEVAKGAAIAGAIPPGMEAAGRGMFAAESALRTPAARARLSAATGQLPFGAAMKRLARDKGNAGITRMGEAVESSGMGGQWPIPSRASYSKNVDDVLERSGQQIDALQSQAGREAGRVDLGPTIRGLREEAAALRRDVPFDDAATDAALLEQKANELAKITSTQGRRPPTAQEAQAKADAILDKAAQKQNEIIDAGRQAGLSEQEIADQAAAVWESAQQRAESALHLVERPYDVNYSQAHAVRKWADRQAWNRHTGDKAASDRAELYGRISSRLRDGLDDAIESEASALREPLRQANAEYEAARWVKQKGDAGGGSRTSQLLGIGSGALAATGGADAGVATGVGAFLTGEAVRRYGPGAAAGTLRAARDVAGWGGRALSSPAVSEAAGAAVGAERGAASAVSRTGPQSLAPADALAMIEDDPEAFGANTEAVRRAAEEGDVRSMQMAMMARR